MNTFTTSRILAGAILTVIALFATKSLWLKEGVSVQFDYEAQKDLSVQLFYCPAPDIPFTEGASIKERIQKGKGNVSVFIPTGSKIARFRIDEGQAPGRFGISNVHLIGNTDTNLDLNKFVTRNIQHYDVKDDGSATVISSLRDPYLVYKDELDVRPGYWVEWLIFITFCVVSYFFASKTVKYLLDFKALGPFPRRDIYFLSVFFVLLFLPMFRINSEDVSKEENRTLAKKPELARLYDEQYNYGSLFETWFSDRFFGRSFLIGLHGKLGWGESKKGNKRVLLGKEGWMFYINDYNEQDFRNEHPATSADLEKSAGYVADLAEWCRRNNKDFYFFVAPNKHRVYGEYYRCVHRNKPDSQSLFNRFLKHAQAKGVSVIYPINELLQAKRTGKLLYWKHDTHWNARGAYVGYLALMQKMNEKDGLYSVVEPDFITCTQYGRDLEGMYPNVPPDDNALYVQHKEKPDITTIGKKIGSRAIFTQKNPRKQGKVVVYRDSFTTALAPYLSETFGVSTYIWRYHVEPGDYEKYLQHADIVILETVERYIPKLGQQQFILK